MRILKSHSILKLANSYIIDSPQPSNLSYLWNFGSLLLVCLVIQIITGVTLAMHYNPSVSEAFNSVEHIMRDVNNGWLIRYLHSNTASAFFFLVYLHIGRGFYYGSYRSPRSLTWSLGAIILILMIGTGFLGYVLVYGQMSLWGATVITNLMSAIPWVGQDIVEFIWGGFSVNNATLNRFFALHFVLPFILIALALMHLIALHDTVGSSNPLGISGNYDRLPFAPYFLFKDLVTIFIFIFVLSVFVFFMPNALGDSENYIMANPMQTPTAIVPEWYLLPFYAILRSIPNKLLGVIAMFSSLLVLVAMPYLDLGRSIGLQFRPFSKIAFYIFVANFLMLMILGAKHVEYPFVELGQLCTAIYFLYYLAFMPIISIIENTLLEISDNKYKLLIKSFSNRINNISTYNKSKFIIKNFENKEVKLSSKIMILATTKLVLFCGIIISVGSEPTAAIAGGWDSALEFIGGITKISKEQCDFLSAHPEAVNRMHLYLLKRWITIICDVTQSSYLHYTTQCDWSFTKIEDLKFFYERKCEVLQHLDKFDEYFTYIKFKTLSLETHRTEVLDTIEYSQIELKNIKRSIYAQNEYLKVNWEEIAKNIRNNTNNLRR